MFQRGKLLQFHAVEIVSAVAVAVVEFGINNRPDAGREFRFQHVVFKGDGLDLRSGAGIEIAFFQSGEDGGGFFVFRKDIDPTAGKVFGGVDVIHGESGIAETGIQQFIPVDGIEFPPHVAAGIIVNFHTSQPFQRHDLIGPETAPVGMGTENERPNGICGIDRFLTVGECHFKVLRQAERQEVPRNMARTDGVHFHTGDEGHALAIEGGNGIGSGMVGKCKDIIAFRLVKVDQFSGGQFAVGSGAVGVQSGPVNIQFPSKKIHRFHIFLLC